MTAKNSWNIDFDENVTPMPREHINKVLGCRRRVFSTEEDELLAELVTSKVCSNWFEVAQRLPGRTARQCRDRWSNYLCPTNSFAPWTPEEDQLIVDKVNEIGTKWSTIAKYINGRSDNHIKNRWYSGLKALCSTRQDGKYFINPNKNQKNGKKVEKSKGESKNQKLASRKKETPKPQHLPAPMPTVQTQAPMLMQPIPTPIMPMTYTPYQTTVQQIAQSPTQFQFPYKQPQESTQSLFHQYQPYYHQTTSQFFPSLQTNQALAEETVNEQAENDLWDRQFFNQLNELNQDPFDLPDMYADWY